MHALVRFLVAAPTYRGIEAGCSRQLFPGAVPNPKIAAGSGLGAVCFMFRDRMA